MATNKNTAAKKTAGKSTAKPGKKSTGKSMVSWSEELAKRATAAAAIEENVGAGGAFISLKGGRMTFQGAEIPGNKINVVVLDHILEYSWFLESYDADNPQTPDVYAFGRDENTITWHENSLPEYAGELCKDSDINQWGSADKGRGKAAKNMRRLALLTEDQVEDAESIGDATPAFLKVPVTSVKGWAGYVRQLEKTLQRPPLGVITEISVVPDPKTQFKLQFRLVEAIEDGDVIEALLQKADNTEIDFPYAPRSEDEEEEKPKRGGKASKGQGRGAPQRGKAGVQRNVVQARKPAGKAAGKAAGGKASRKF